MANMKDYPLVSVIILNYNTTKDTCDLLDSFKKVTYENYELIVIDNASTIGDPSLISQLFPEVKYIESEVNLGFAGGNNLGVTHANGEYILFLNNDIIVDPHFIEPLVEVLKNKPKVGKVSPKVLFYKSNEIQFAGMNSINKWTARGSALNYLEPDSEKFNIIKPTHYAFGAAMMVPMNLILKVGLLPDLYFLYYEELDWSEIFRKHGYEILYVGTSSVYHKNSVSIGEDSVLKVYYMNRNRLLFQRRNCSLLQKTVSLWYILLIGFPKTILQYTFSNEYSKLKYYLKGILWNFTHWDIHNTPSLVINSDGSKSIRNSSNERMIETKTHAAMKIKELIKNEREKILVQRESTTNSFLINWLLFWRLVSLGTNMVKTKVYLRKCTEVGRIALTFGKPKIINRGKIRIGSLVRMVSNINRVLIDVDKKGELTIGNNCRINGANISVHSKVVIGNNCRIAPHTIIMDGDHHDKADRLRKGKTNPIIIEDDVWLATRTMVLKGVKIGKGAVIASGAVVTKDIPPDTLAAGVPAKVIKENISKNQ